MTALVESKEKAPRERLKDWRHYREGRSPRPCLNSDALQAPESQSFLRNIVAGRHSRAWKNLGHRPGTDASAIPNYTKPSSNGQQLLIIGKKESEQRKQLQMYNTIVCAIVVVMLASTVVAKPRNNQTNGQTREQYCRRKLRQH